MKSESECLALLKELMKEKRYLHSLRVAETAQELAAHWGLDSDKARLAGLVHDCGKELNPELAQEKGVLLQPKSFELYQVYPKVWHALEGPSLCRVFFGIEDPDVLTAVQWHTTGTAAMPPLAEVVFVSDFIEPGRPYPECVWIRKMAYHSMTQAVFALCAMVLGELKEKGAVIHPDTQACYTYYRSKLSQAQLDEVDQLLRV